MNASEFGDCVVTRDVFQVLKLHSPAAHAFSCNFEFLKNITRDVL